MFHIYLVPTKLSKLDNPTDHLVEKKAPVEKAVWERSIGSLSSKKGGLGVLVKKKTSNIVVSKKDSNTSSNGAGVSKDPGGGGGGGSVSSAVVKASNALGLLGNYSGSSDSTSD